MTVTLSCLAALLALALYREHQIQRERIRWENERRELLNRIKPETAIPVPFAEQPTEPMPPVIVGPYGDIDRIEGTNGAA